LAGATCKEKSSARQIRKHAAVICGLNVEDVGHNGRLQMLDELDSLVAVLQFGNKDYTM
jgi:hypothetical protein